MQLCAEAGAVVTTGSGGVWVGETVTTGGFPAVHPLTIMKPAMTSRRMHNKPEVFRAMVPDIMLDMIIIWGNNQTFFKEELFEEIYLVRLDRVRSPVIFFPRSSL